MKNKDLTKLDGIYAVETINMVNQLAITLGQPKKKVVIASALMTINNLIMN